MKAQDIVIVNVTGTNGSTRNQRTISRQFNGAGQRLNDQGQVDAGSPEVLRNLPGASALTPPQLPAAEMAAATAKLGDINTKVEGLKQLKELQIAFAQQVQAWEKESGGGNEKLQIAKSVLEYTKEFHGFQETDGDHFVIKLENLAVTEGNLPDGRSMYTVAGTAVFGATA